MEGCVAGWSVACGELFDEGGLGDFGGHFEWSVCTICCYGGVLDFELR